MEPTRPYSLTDHPRPKTSNGFHYQMSSELRLPHAFRKFELEGLHHICQNFLRVSFAI